MDLCPDDAGRRRPPGHRIGIDYHAHHLQRDGGMKPALFAGMLVAMSSTAVIMKLLTDRGEIDAPFGRVAVSVLFLQDLLVTACMISLPLLSELNNLRETSGENSA